VFCLFIFILMCNVVGLIPYSFTVTSHIIVTALLALLVFFTVVIIGIKEHGLGFFKLFVPSGVPIYILPLVVAIEIISFLSRPLSHSVRLFANMLAGHITLNVFGGFCVMLLGAGAALKVVAILPFAMTIGLYALELLVAFLQAYVFTMLTCIPAIDRPIFIQKSKLRSHEWNPTTSPTPLSTLAQALPLSERAPPASASARCSASS